MERVVIVCNHTIPTEHPNGIRMLNIGLMFQMIGYQVYLFGIDNGKNRELKYKGIICRILHEKSGHGLLAKSERSLAFKKFIQKELIQIEPSIIVSNLYNCRAQRELIRYSRNKHIPMIESVCEWYDINNFNGIARKISLINNRYSLRCQFPRIKNVIVISTLLRNYYLKHGCNCLLIPTNVDPNDYSSLCTHSYDEKVRIAYAGKPAKKDLILNAITAISSLSEKERKKVAFDIYGITREQLTDTGISPDTIMLCGDSLHFHGKIPYSEVRNKVNEADFTILLRPQKRYANAGFPTKIGESMACGTPVITNLTSDIGMYIHDGKEGIICKSENPNDCADAIRRVLTLTEDEKSAMRRFAHEAAESVFNYMTYAGDVKNYILSIAAKKDAER